MSHEDKHEHETCCGHGHEHSHGGEGESKKEEIVKLSLSAVFLAAAIIFSELVNLNFSSFSSFLNTFVIAIKTFFSK